MDGTLYLRAIFSLLFVIGLLLLSFWIVRRLKLFGAGMTGAASRAKRLSIGDSLMLDNRRRLLIVRRDHIEHLILLSPSGETVIESGIAPARDEIA